MSHIWMSKEKCNFFPLYLCTNGSLFKLIEPGLHWLDVRWTGAVFQCCPQGTAFIETSSEKLYWVRAESAARLWADCLTVLSHMLSILRSQWEKTQLPSLSKKTKCWRAGRCWGALRYCCFTAGTQPGLIHQPMSWDAILDCMLVERLEVCWLEVF